MKKLTLIAFAIFASVLLSQNANAVLPTLDMKTVNENTLADQDVFGWAETPSLYYETAPAVNGSLLSFWLEGNNFAGQVATGSSGSGYLQIPTWDSIKTAGTWTVKGFYTTDQGMVLCDSTNFVVTPEPISMILFGIGGLPLAAGLLRRKKNV